MSLIRVSYINPAFHDSSFLILQRNIANLISCFIVFQSPVTFTSFKLHLYGQLPLINKFAFHLFSESSFRSRKLIKDVITVELLRYFQRVLRLKSSQGTTLSKVLRVKSLSFKIFLRGIILRFLWKNTFQRRVIPLSLSKSSIKARFSSIPLRREAAGGGQFEFSEQSGSYWKQGKL